MNNNNLVPFEISHLDSLGQGVSKITDKITFIAKTLPNETGTAQIFHTKKGVAFAEVKSIEITSPQRINPDCPHFLECPSCHYQHTSYENELSFKEKSLSFLLKNIPHPKIEVFSATQRTGYRNRIQLHYDLKLDKLGIIRAFYNDILEVPRCLIGNPIILKELENLYHQKRWRTLAPTNVNRGHVELYDSPNGLKLTWNAPYAEGGFTQVYELMNLKLLAIIREHQQKISVNGVLDLFAGNGNISNQLNHSKRLCVDFYSSAVSEPFYSQDLYGQDAIKNVAKKLEINNCKPELVIFDPPRSGVKDISLWLKRFSPQQVIYVSCNPQTLVRDLNSIENYHLTKIVLLDFFPSTYHFETVAFLSKK